MNVLAWPDALTAIGLIVTALTVLGWVRRRRLVVLDRRRRLEAVLHEVTRNLDLIRKRWSSEYGVLNWRAWLHGSPLQTRAWREHRAAVTAGLEGGPAIAAELASELDALSDEFEQGEQRFQSDWETRSVELALRLRAILERYPPRWWDRATSLGSARADLPAISETILTPATPADVQRGSRTLGRTRARATVS